MKSLNRSIILNKIRTDGPISRADIAKATTLTPPTVSSIVKELIDSGLIAESSQGESSGGRKPTNLIINGRNSYVIGLDVGPKHVNAILTDLNGEILEENQILINPATSNDELLNLLQQTIKRLIKPYKGQEDKIIGIGVGMHGVVDVKKGLSLFAPILQLRNIPIKEYLEKEFGILVKVENDARALALGESWFGNGDGVENSVTINVGSGIGAGIVINGKLFHGENDIGGEIGHMSIDINGPECSCGNNGCLQTLAAGPALAEKARREISKGKKSILKEMVKDNLEEIDGKLIYEAALKGDQLSIDIFKEAGEYLGIGLTNLIHTINPQKIIIGGGVSKAGDLLLDSVKETVKKRGITESAKQTEIVLSHLGDNGTAIGAVTLILVELFSHNSLG
ncbi:ROK family transcriptional regulator [Pseudalkalibacillus caeni]|uniref:ROK family transcriptional regulator n=1 Tax=Exobacillus caeni TaxID=2574798 RepID=A0A5R9F8K1_9BACL|nr:ROK family transcriptional regulator [Pseudalkalibacillus caeni]TLS38570.1 ROK family transcriptional regulator [Pseudalkalibacillus caeni]